MRKQPAIWMAALSVLSTSAFGTMVANADTVSQQTPPTLNQSTAQSVYANQNQTANTETSGNVGQSEQSSLSSDTSLTTNTRPGDTSTQYINQLGTNSKVDHTLTGDASATQNQSNSSGSSMTEPTSSGASLNVQASGTAQSGQSGNADSSGTATLSQSSTNVLVGSQTQAVQQQSATTPKNAPSHSYTHSQTIVQTVTVADQGPYVTLPQPKDGNTSVAGFAVFDARGYAMSDKFGNNNLIANNNGADHFHQMIPNQANEVVVSAVNSVGQPVVNTKQTTVYLVTSNAHGWFQDETTGQSILAVVLPAGVTGIRIQYTNYGAIASYDVIDATTTNPYTPRTVSWTQTWTRSYGTVNVLGTSQTQSMSLGNSQPDSKTSTGITEQPSSTLNQSQQVVVKDNTQQTLASDTQNASVNQNASASQNQQLVAPPSGGSDNPPASTDNTNNGDSNSNVSNTLSESQSANVSSSLSPTNVPLGATTSNPTATVTQTETSTTTQDLNMSQSQSVTVVAPVIDFQLSQSQTQTDTTTTLTESISATATQNGWTSNVTTVTVEVGNQSRQLYLPTNGPVTVTESQVLVPTEFQWGQDNWPALHDTSHSTSESEQNDQEVPPPVIDTATLSYTTSDGHTVNIPLTGGRLHPWG